MSREAGFPVAPAFVGDLDLVADLFGFSAMVQPPICCDAQVAGGEIIRNPMLNGEVIRLDGAIRMAPK